MIYIFFFFFSSRRRHTIFDCDWSSDVCSSDLLVLRAFASGCTALTGVEAISNGVPAFKHPEARNAAITMGWMAAVLGTLFIGVSVLAANTSFADFPRLNSLLARDRYAPRQFRTLGDRLVFSNGILILAGLAAALIVVFGGDTHALIPLYAVGVFISFTLSQAGMVRHWLTDGGAGWRWRLGVNGVGALVTGAVTVVIAVTKFTHGAWVG